MPRGEKDSHLKTEREENRWRQEGRPRRGETFHNGILFSTARECNLRLSGRSESSGFKIEKQRGLASSDQVSF